MLTAAEGIPSTNIKRRSFLTASLRSAADLTFEDDLGNAKILLNDFAVSEVEGFEDIRYGSKEERGLQGMLGADSSLVLAVRVKAGLLE